MAMNQPAAIISRNESRGGTEPMPPVYRTPGLNCWTLRVCHHGRHLSVVAAPFLEILELDVAVTPARPGENRIVPSLRVAWDRGRRNKPLPSGERQCLAP